MLTAGMSGQNSYYKMSTASTSHQKRHDLISTSPFENDSKRLQEKSLFSQPLSEDTHLQSNLCLKHSLPLVSCCFSCKLNLLCSGCVKEHLDAKPSISQHDIRDISKSCTLIKNSLIEHTIKLDAKCNILTNLQEQINSNKLDLYTGMKDYKQTLKQNFEHLRRTIELKENEMIRSLNQLYCAHEQKLSKAIESIKQSQNCYEYCQQTLQNFIQEQNQFSVCYFYAHKQPAIEQLLDEAEIDQIKSQIYEVKWQIKNSQNNLFENLLHNVSSLQIKDKRVHSYAEFNFDGRDKEREKIEEQLIRDSVKKIVKVKSQNHLLHERLPSQCKKKTKKSASKKDLEKQKKSTFKTPSFKVIESRFEKQRQTHKATGTFCTSTPKENASKQKKYEVHQKSPSTASGLVKLKKRRRSFGKIISMPASPSKKDNSNSVKRLSPECRKGDLSRNQLAQNIPDGAMKKKSTLRKKK